MASKQTIHAIGKRKSSIARVYLRPGSGKITVNHRTLDNYFPIESQRTYIQQPLEAVEKTEAFDITVNVRGSGPMGQAGAIRHGLARALVEHDPELRGILKKKQMLTRDSRIKERKKYGQKGARGKFQFSKR